MHRIYDMLTDAHAHLISDDHVRYPPAPPSGKLGPNDLDDPCTAERLLTEMDRCGVDRAVLVHRNSIYGYDNSYVCDAATRYPDRFVAVGSIDGFDPQAADRVRYWTTERGLAGIRFMEPVKGAELTWLTGPPGLHAWRQAHELRVPACVHFFRWNRVAGLAALAGILEQLPDMTVVIDHFSNMDWAAGPPDYGFDAPLLAIAKFPNVYVKFTTIPLGAIQAAGQSAAPILARVIEAFGAQRLMWGSDITQSKGSYRQMVELLHNASAALTPAQRDHVMYRTADEVYRGR
jgi:predicted TIM-barrel fold metal-dependent hydrolase